MWRLVSRGAGGTGDRGDAAGVGRLGTGVPKERAPDDDAGEVAAEDSTGDAGRAATKSASAGRRAMTTRVARKPRPATAPTAISFSALQTRRLDHLTQSTIADMEREARDDPATGRKLFRRSPYGGKGTHKGCPYVPKSVGSAGTRPALPCPTTLALRGKGRPQGSPLRSELRRFAVMSGGARPDASARLGPRAARSLAKPLRSHRYDAGTRNANPGT